MNNCVETRMPRPYPSGNQSISMRDGASIQQTVILSLGSHTITFYACLNPNDLGQNGGFNVTVNGAGVGGFLVPNITWQKFTITFTVTTASNAIRFISNSGNRNLQTGLDNIIVT